jgi:hypothetical protein
MNRCLVNKTVTGMVAIPLNGLPLLKEKKSQ